MISLELKKSKKGKTDINYCHGTDIVVDKWIDLVLGMLALGVAYGVKLNRRGNAKALISFSISFGVSDMKL